MVSLGQVETLQIMLGNLLRRGFFISVSSEWNRSRVMTNLQMELLGQWDFTIKCGVLLYMLMVVRCCFSHSHAGNQS
jgi:hypothetical protein